MVFPLPSKEKWEDYNNSYFINAHGGLTSSTWIETYNIGLAKIRLAALTNYLKEQNLVLSSVLEVGPGQGYLMREIKNRFPKLNYYVVESDASVHDILAKHGATIVDSADVENINNLDAVIATHVLEHTLDPINFLTYYTNPLRAGGVVFIETPCLDHAYKDVHEPHVLFFEKSTLGRVFRDCKLNNIRLTYNGDVIPSLRRNGFLRKCLVKLELKTGVPFHYLFGKFWAAKVSSALSYQESLAITETSPHIEQKSPSRWVRGFGTKLG